MLLYILLLFFLCIFLFLFFFFVFFFAKSIFRRWQQKHEGNCIGICSKISSETWWQREDLCDCCEEMYVCFLFRYCQFWKSVWDVCALSFQPLTSNPWSDICSMGMSFQSSLMKHIFYFYVLVVLVPVCTVFWANLLLFWFECHEAFRRIGAQSTESKQWIKWRKTLAHIRNFKTYLFSLKQIRSYLCPHFVEHIYYDCESIVSGTLRQSMLCQFCEFL